MALRSPFVWMVGTFASLVTALLVACRASGRAMPETAVVHRVRVACASDLTLVMGELSQAIQQVHPDLKVETQFGPSGALYAQILEGAPVDIFLSADSELPKKLAAVGLSDLSGPFLYARGKLVMWVGKFSPINLSASGIHAVLDPSVHTITMANAQTAPYGRAAQAAMLTAGLLDQIHARISIAASVAQAAQFAEGGEADIGFLSASYAYAPRMQQAGRAWPVAENLYPPIIQSGVILRGVGDQEGASWFKAFLLSTEGADILARYGLDRI